MVEVIKARIKSMYNPYMVIAVIYFFLNALFLPEGLLYTTILTPLFLLWLWKEKPLQPFICFVALTSVFAVIHILIGVQLQFYLRSWAMAFCAFSFAVTVHFYLKKNPAPELIIENIAFINMLLIPIAILALFIHPLNEYFWYYKPISPGVQSFPRLKMLTYEAAYYSLIFVPVFLYYILKVIFNKSASPLMALIIVAIPLALSLSFGVILMMALTVGLILILHFKTIVNTKKKKQWLLFTFLAFLAATVIILFVFPDNPIAKRLFNVLDNNDTSMRGRTTEAFKLAWMIMEGKSRIFGVGFGQIKVLGHELIINYYKYYEPHPVVRIPNSLAETLAMFGVFGLSLRMALEVFFFIKTKTYSNVFRLSVFIFIFFYQFTGSFLFNVAELTLWVIAFTPCFPQFDITELKQKAEA